jgi:hypothetical protein
VRPSRNLRVLCLSSLAALLLAAPAAPAKSPSTADQMSLDWVLQRIVKDREADKSGEATLDPTTAYKEGKTPIEKWEDLVKLIRDPTAGKMSERDRAVTAIRQRFAAEDAAKRTDPAILLKEKQNICRATLDMMTRGETNSLNLVLGIQKALLPAERVTWNPTDSRSKIKQAYEALKKFLGVK